MKVLVDFIGDMDTTARRRFLRLPDIPGHVVQVHRLIFGLQAFTSATAVVIVFMHNVATDAISTNDVNTQWARMDAGASGGGPNPMHVPFTPVPYELVGVQRMDYQLSAGTGDGSIQVHYTTRTERNRTVWNELRRRTSFELN